MSIDTNKMAAMQFVNTSNTFMKADDLEGEIESKDKTKKTEKVQKQKEFSINIDKMTPIDDLDDPVTISTLDEPVSVTIMRDLKAVGYKFGHVFFPKRSKLLLKDWDLWGPLFLSVLLAISLQGDDKISTHVPEFANIFALITLGAVVITVNTKLLSGKISFFQSICVLGYCLLPLVGVSLLNYWYFILFSATSKSIFLFTIRCILIFLAFAWSVFASTAFLAADTINLNERKLLALYPIFLFYFVIAWLIILHTY